MLQILSARCIACFLKKKKKTQKNYLEIVNELMPCQHPPSGFLGLFMMAFFYKMLYHYFPPCSRHILGSADSPRICFIPVWHTVLYYLNPNQPLCWIPCHHISLLQKPAKQRREACTNLLPSWVPLPLPTPSLSHLMISTFFSQLPVPACVSMFSQTGNPVSAPFHAFRPFPPLCYPVRPPQRLVSWWSLKTDAARPGKSKP